MQNPLKRLPRESFVEVDNVGDRRGAPTGWRHSPETPAPSAAGAGRRVCFLPSFAQIQASSALGRIAGRVVPRPAAAAPPSRLPSDLFRASLVPGARPSSSPASRARPSASSLDCASPVPSARPASSRSSPARRFACGDGKSRGNARPTLFGGAEHSHLAAPSSSVAFCGADPPKEPSSIQWRALASPRTRIFQARAHHLRRRCLQNEEAQSPQGSSFLEKPISRMPPSTWRLRSRGRTLKPTPWLPAFSALFTFVVAFVCLLSSAPSASGGLPSPASAAKASWLLGASSPLFVSPLLFARADPPPRASPGASLPSAPVSEKRTCVPPYNYDEILEQLAEIQARCPSRVRVSDWGVTTGLSIFMRRFTCGKTGVCQLPLVEVGDAASLSAATPTLFFSGAVHGDERAGPTAAVELVRYLCERYGVDDEITYLVRHRRVLVMPFPNAVGFAWSFREEAGIDVNRDFPYQRQANQCFQSVAGRAINEIFRSYLIIGGITWHGGMRAVSYPWGSHNHAQQLSRDSWESRPSPDDAAFKSLARVLQRAGGRDAEKSDFYYPIGAISDLVYPVNGGMEDWAYGASFEASPDPISVCAPEAYELPAAQAPAAGSNPASLFSPFQVSDVSLAAAAEKYLVAPRGGDGRDRAASDGEGGERGQGADAERRPTASAPNEESGAARDPPPGSGARLGSSLRGAVETGDEETSRRDAEWGEGEGAQLSEQKRTEGDPNAPPVYSYPSARSVYGHSDVRSALFLVEMHDDKNPSHVSMGPRPVDRPDLLLPGESEDEKGDPVEFRRAVEKGERVRRSDKGDYLMIRNVRLALKFIEKAQPDLVFTSTPPLYQPPGAVSIFGFYPVGCNTLTSVQLEIRRGHCRDLLSLAPAPGVATRAAALRRAWHEADLLVRETGKNRPVACRQLGPWERVGSLDEDDDRPPAGVEWWGGGGNKDIELNQGTPEQKRNRVELQYKIPPEAVDGDYCGVLFATFDQDWKHQKHAEPRLPPQSHLARLRLEDKYVARSSEGPGVIVGHQTWLFPASMPALYPAVATPGYPFIVRGDNIEGFARLRLPLSAFYASAQAAPSQQRPDVAGSPSAPDSEPSSAFASTLEMFVNFGGDFNEERFRLHPFTGVLKYPRAANPPLAIVRTDISLSLNLPISSLPTGRFLFAVFRDGDLLQRNLMQLLFPSAFAFSDSASGASRTLFGSKAAEDALLSAVLVGEVPTGSGALAAAERVQQETRVANIVRQKQERDGRSPFGGGLPRFKSAWLKNLAATRKQNAPTVAEFAVMDASHLRGRAHLPITALLGRALFVQWVPAAAAAERGAGDGAAKVGGERKAAETKEAVAPASGEDAVTSLASLARARSAWAVIGASLHTPSALYAIHEHLAPLPVERSGRPAASSPPFVARLACLFRQARAALAEAAKAQRETKREELPAAVDGGETGKLSDEQRPAEAKRDARRNVEDDSVLEDLIGHLQLTFAIEDDIGERRGKEDTEADEESDPRRPGASGRVMIQAELCETSMGVAPATPLHLRFHEDCCPPLTLYPSSTGLATDPAHPRLSAKKSHTWIGRLLGVTGSTGDKERQTVAPWPPRDNTIGSWELPESTAEFLSLNNCRCGPGTMVTLATVQNLPSSLHAPRSAMPAFPSNTFFLPPVDSVDPALGRVLTCALGLVPPVPGDAVSSSSGTVNDAEREGPPTGAAAFGGDEAGEPFSSAAFASRFVCGTSSQPSWRQWKAAGGGARVGAVAPHGSAPTMEESPPMDGNSRQHAAGKTEAQSGVKRPWDAFAVGASGAERTPEEEGNIVHFAAFVDAARDTTEDEDDTLSAQIYIAGVIAALGAFCIISPCVISAYTCLASRCIARDIELAPRHDGETDHLDQFHGPEAAGKEGGDDSEETKSSFFPHKSRLDRFGLLVNDFANASRRDAGGETQVKKAEGRAIFAKSNLFSSQIQGPGGDDDNFTSPSSSGLAGMSTVSRGISGASGTNGGYEPFFSITGEEYESDEETEGVFGQ